MKKVSVWLIAMLVSFNFISCKKDEQNNPVVPPKSLDYDQNVQDILNQGWTKVFEDDFSSDFSNWNIWVGGAYNNEYQYYSSNPTNLKIVDGKLIITAKKEKVTGATTIFDATPKSFDFTSGRIESKTTISANSTTPKVRVSARIKLPNGYGMWPAFWSYGNNWPTNGEIDILEARGNYPNTFNTNYFYGTTAGTNQVSNAASSITSDTSLTQYWHVYELVWEQNSLTFYLDGNIVDQKLSSTTSGQYIVDLFGKAQNITFNLAVGGAYFNNPSPSTIQTGTMYVDWVRVYNQ